MSMISGLIDRLNKSADEWNGNNMFELARMCREAADTINELRGALQVASADYRHLQEENAKLREERDTYRDLVGCMVHPDIPDQLYAENAKLRELVRDVYQCSRQVGCDHCGDGYRRNCGVLDSMRELGVEVDDG